MQSCEDFWDRSTSFRSFLLLRWLFSEPGKEEVASAEHFRLPEHFNTV